MMGECVGVLWSTLAPLSSPCSRPVSSSPPPPHVRMCIIGPKKSGEGRTEVMAGLSTRDVVCVWQAGARKADAEEHQWNRADKSKATPRHAPRRRKRKRTRTRKRERARQMNQTARDEHNNNASLPPYTFLFVLCPREPSPHQIYLASFSSSSSSCSALARASAAFSAASRIMTMKTSNSSTAQRTWAKTPSLL